MNLTRLPYLGLFLFWLMPNPSARAQQNDAYCLQALFQPIRDSIPEVINNLGNSPQFDLLRNHQGVETFFPALKAYGEGGKGIPDADRAELNSILQCIGYTAGILDPALTVDSVEKVRFFTGAQGMLGNDEHGYEYSLILNTRKGGIIHAWRIRGPEDKPLYIMSDCGNAFVPLERVKEKELPCPKCPTPEVRVAGKSGIQLYDSASIAREIEIPIFTQQGCCRGKEDSSLIELAATDLAYRVKAIATVDTLIVSTVAQATLDSMLDLTLIPIDDSTYYGLKLTVTATEPAANGFLLPGYRYYSYNDNILRASVGSEFGEHVQVIDDPNPFILSREVRYKNLFSVSLGFEKYLDNCFYLALDGMYGAKRIEDTYDAFEVIIQRGRRDTIPIPQTVEVPEPLHYIGLSTTLLYELKNCGNRLKIGLGPHILQGISSRQNAGEFISDIPDNVRNDPAFQAENPDPEVDFSYQALGLHGEVALLLTDRLEAFVQAGFNNHRYQNQSIRQFDGRIGLKYAFSKKKEFRQLGRKIKQL